MTTWDLKQQAVTRVSSKGTRAEWLWFILEDGVTIEGYKNEQQAVDRIDQLRMENCEG